MIPKTYFDVAGQIVATHPVSVIKLECRAHGSLGAGCFWQVHDFAPETNLAVPAEASVPIKSWPAYAGVLDYKEFKAGELNLANGLYLCISTTEATKTLGTGNNKFAMLQVELVGRDLWESATAAEAANATSLQVWAEAATPRKLIRFKAKNKDLSARWLMLFAADSPSVGDVPVAVWPIGTLNSTIEGRFGSGRAVQSNTSGTAKRGCTFVFSTNARTYQTLGIVTGMDIYAEYL